MLFYACHINDSLGESGHWALDYTSPQSFMITFSYLLSEQLWGLNFIKF